MASAWRSLRRQYCAIIGVIFVGVIFVAAVFVPVSAAATTAFRSDALALAADVVDEEVLAEAIGAGVERTTAIDAGHALDEGAQARAVVEHEGVDGDAHAG